MDPFERIDRATEFAAANISRMRTDDLDNETPCKEFDVRALLNHMLGAMTVAATAARGERPRSPRGAVRLGSRCGKFIAFLGTTPQRERFVCR